MRKIISACLALLLCVSLLPVGASAAGAISRVSRDDGTWLFPTESRYWNSFTDWAGCTGTDTYCSLCGENHVGGWGDPYHGGQGGHNGIDIGAGYGAAVYAAAAGTAYTGYNSARGNYIVIEHWLDNNYSYYSYYQHLSTVAISNGQQVSAGSTIGAVGGTGVGSGVHLHFGIVMAKKGSIINAVGLSSAEGNGWITTAGNRTGRILNNPAAGSMLPTAGGSVIAALKYHAGSVSYTFDANHVSIGKKQEAPAAPVISNSYANLNYTVGDSVSISWGQVENADEYNYYLAKYPQGYAYESPIKSGSTTSTSVTFNDLKAGRYYFFLQARNSAGSSPQSNWIMNMVVDDLDYVPVRTEVLNNHIYAVYDNCVEWTYADELCKKMGGHLATISSAEENEFIKNLVQAGSHKHYWLGYRAKDPYTGDFSYSATNGEGMEYTNWGSGEPNHLGDRYSKEGFASIYTVSGRWNDAANTAPDPMGFVLEIEMDKITPAAQASSQGKTYYRYDYPMTWTEANAFCQAKGGRLAVVDNDSDYQAMSEVTNNLNSDSEWFFVGGFKSGASDTFNWVNGKAATSTVSSSLIHQIYKNDEANRANYMMMYGNGKSFTGLMNYYKYRDHMKHIGFLCEVADSTPTPSPTPNPPSPSPAPDSEKSEVHFPKVTVYFQGQFSDVPADQWFTNNVANAFSLGLMKGNSSTTFNPYGDVTVAEAIAMAARIHSIYTTGTENFTQGTPWYQCYLDYAYKNKIISYAYYNCDVKHKATRAQFAEIFAAALPDEALSIKNSVSDNAVPDVKMKDSYSAPVYKLYRAGILAGGDAKGTFSPGTFITRAECATIVARMADSDNRVSFSLA